MLVRKKECKRTPARAREEEEKSDKAYASLARSFAKLVFDVMFLLYCQRSSRRKEKREKKNMSLSLVLLRLQVVKMMIVVKL